MFTGGAGSGESDIRKWVIENDWLEAVVALPEQMFYNTPIGTYIWIVTNRKEKRRKGKIQLVDAREFYVPMRRSLGNKRRKLGEGPDRGEPDQIGEIVRAFATCEETDAAFLRDARGNGLKWIVLAGGARKPVPAEGQTVEVRCVSKLFDNVDFGFRRVTVERPLRLRFQMDTDRKSRFLDALPQLLDDVQAIDKKVGREPQPDWDSVREEIDLVLADNGSKWKKAELKLFRDVFCEVEPRRGGMPYRAYQTPDPVEGSKVELKKQCSTRICWRAFLVRPESNILDLARRKRPMSGMMQPFSHHLCPHVKRD